jgi:hypothetical protein
VNKLSVRCQNFIANSQCFTVDGRLNTRRLRKLVISGECRKYWNFGKMAEDELRAFLNLPREMFVCPHCHKPL